MREFPALPANLTAAIRDVTPSRDQQQLYYPCEVTLKDGSRLDFVYLTEGETWETYWGADYEGRKFVDITDIASLRESSNRLPVALANKLYAAGETGMGFNIFTVCFNDGSTVVYGSGNCVDFIDYPRGKTASDITDVLPHVGRDEPYKRNVHDYWWVLFRSL